MVVFEGSASKGRSEARPAPEQYSYHRPAKLVPSTTGQRAAPHAQVRFLVSAHRTDRPWALHRGNAARQAEGAAAPSLRIIGAAGNEDGITADDRRRCLRQREGRGPRWRAGDVRGRPRASCSSWSARRCEPICAGEHCRPFVLAGRRRLPGAVSDHRVDAGLTDGLILVADRRRRSARSQGSRCTWWCRRRGARRARSRW